MCSGPFWKVLSGLFPSSPGSIPCSTDLPSVCAKAILTPDIFLFIYLQCHLKVSSFCLGGTAKDSALPSVQPEPSL